MKVYYVAGLPYSDELFHYGTKGMKWGVRLYQNPDGTLTPLGKAHYATKTVVKAVGGAAVKATKAVAKHEVDKFKQKHPWTMSDEEIKERMNRVKLEISYKQALRDRSNLNRGKALTREVLESGYKTLGTKFFNSLGDKMFNKKDPKLRDLEDLLNDPKATAKEFETAKKVWDAKKEMQRDRDLDKTYDILNIKSTKDMTKRDLDNINAWLSSERRTSEAIRKTEEYQTGRDALDEWLQKRSHYN